MKKNLLLLAMMATLTSLAQPTANLIRKYSFTGGSLNDEAGTANLSQNGNPLPANDRFNVAGNAFQFNGTSHALFTSNKIDLNSNNQLSFSYWMKTEEINTGSGYAAIISQWSNDPQTEIFMLGHKNANAFNAVRTVYTQGETAVAGYSTNTWYHVVVSFDKNSNNELKTYINNALVATSNTNTAYTNSDDLSAPSPYFTIGANGGVASYTPSPVPFGNSYFKGVIDDIRIYNKVLSTTEVTQLFNEGTTTSLQNVNNPEAGILLYPNPAAKEFMIRGLSSQNPYIISVYTLAGQLIKSEKNFTGESISLKGIGAGVYFIGIQSENSLPVYKKLIIE